MGGKNSRMEHLRHELLTDIADQVTMILRDHNIDAEKAEHIGADVANHLAEHWGGQLITFPKDYLYKIVQRDLDIFQKVTANNMGAVAKEYGLTVNALYRVIRRIRKRAIAERQPDIFDT